MSVSRAQRDIDEAVNAPSIKKHCSVFHGNLQTYVDIESVKVGLSVGAEIREDAVFQEADSFLVFPEQLGIVFFADIVFVESWLDDDVFNPLA